MRALMALGILLVLLAGCGEEDYGGTFSDNEVAYLRALDKGGDLPDLDEAAFDATKFGHELCRDVIVDGETDYFLLYVQLDEGRYDYFTKAGPAAKAAEKYLCPK